jgi:hypothetical protein
MMSGICYKKQPTDIEPILQEKSQRIIQELAIGQTTTQKTQRTLSLQPSPHSETFYNKD